MSSPKSKKSKLLDKKDNAKDKDEESDKEPKELEPDCCDRCLFASFGYLLIFVAMFVVFFSERDHKYSARDISHLTNHVDIIDISPQQKATAIEAQLGSIVEAQHPIHFIDTISTADDKSMLVLDDRTDVSFPGLALKIHTEMYQWTQQEIVVRKEGTTDTKSTYEYVKAWSATFHDSSTFSQQDSHYNPQPTVSQLSTRNVWTDDIVVGSHAAIQLHISKSLYSKLARRDLWKNVTQKAAEYSELELWEMRGGFLYRAYDKVESWFAEPEEKKEEDASNTAAKGEGDGEGGSEGDGDEVMKSADKEAERVRLDQPRTMIGDIRMTIFALDTRGEKLSYLGALKFNEDWNQYFLVPWRSQNNHKYSMLEYGSVSLEDAIARMSTDNVAKLWLIRVASFLAIFIGFAALPNVLNTTVKMLRIRMFGETPFQKWTHYFVASLALSIMLWIVVVWIAYVVRIIHLALTIMMALVVRLLFNNKAPANAPSPADKELQTKKKK